jgi:phenylalanyl-tRNA synthetase alpha chain
MSDLAQLELDLTQAIAAADTSAALEEVRVTALGKSGSVTALLKGMGALSPDERRIQGPLLNGLRDRLTAALAARKSELEAAELEAQLAAETVDLSLPPPPRRKGSVHPTMQAMDEIVSIFAEMGFAVAEGPDIEDDFHNFTALNFPPDHPAREMHDTFFLKPDPETGERKVLRTHTSPVQIRTMRMTSDKPEAPWIAGGQTPPIRIIAPGRTFRKDSDATHTPMFHQVEGLVIDRAIHMGHLKWTLETFVARYFELDGVHARFRPHHFPFTEPSAEMDILCDRSGGELKLNQGDSWMEILGCGMVHPAVLSAAGLDPNEWQGFAFGMGVDRLAMLKYGIPDLRPMFDADVRWLEHFGFSAAQAPSAAAGLS